MTELRLRGRSSQSRRPCLLAICSWHFSLASFTLSVKCLAYSVASFLKKYILLIMLLQLSHFPPSLPSTLHTPSLPHSPPLVHVHGSYILVLWLLHFLTILTLPLSISTYHLCCLFSVPFPPLSPTHSPADNPPCDLHFCGSVSVLVVCLVGFCFCFRCGH